MPAARHITSAFIDWGALEGDDYVRAIPALATMGELAFTTPVTFFVGENGSGKSTLLEAIAVAFGFNAEGGTRNFRFSTYRDVSGLAGALHLARGLERPRTGYFFRAESFFNVATQAEGYWGPDGPSPYGELHKQSHGESFLSFFQTFDRAGLYLMDEPEAALSPQRQLALLSQMAELAQAGAQFVVASHSPILLGTPGARILSFDEGAIHEVAYEDTESYQVTELFINHRERLLRELVG